MNKEQIENEIQQKQDEIKSKKAKIKELKSDIKLLEKDIENLENKKKVSEYDKMKAMIEAQGMTIEEFIQRMGGM